MPIPKGTGASTWFQTRTSRLRDQCSTTEPSRLRILIGIRLKTIIRSAMEGKGIPGRKYGPHW